MRFVDDYKRVGCVEYKPSLDTGLFDIYIYSKCGSEKHATVSKRVVDKILNRLYFGHK